MTFIARILAAAILVAILTGILVGWYENFLLGTYWQQAPIFLTILYGVVWPIAAIVLLGGLIYQIITFKE